MEKSFVSIVSGVIATGVWLVLCAVVSSHDSDPMHGDKYLSFARRGAYMTFIVFAFGAMVLQVMRH